MKLLTRTTILYVVITLLVFSAGSAFFYTFLRDLVDEETTEGLYMKKAAVLEALEQDTTIVANSPLADDVDIRPAASETAESMTDTMIYETHGEELLPFRLLSFPFEKNGQWYRITVRKIMIESDDLVEGIFISFVTVLAVLAVVIIVSMQLVSRRIWKPFFTTLGTMKEFRPGKKNAVVLPGTRIREFKELNTAIEKMIANTESAFQSLKSFSENAAHEIQTPLAVIQSTTEVLLQDPSLTEEQNSSISKLHSTSRKLSSLVTTLLLLTRIENNQFLQADLIDFSSVVRQKLTLLWELFEQKNLTMQIDVKTEVHLKLHPVLADILVTNLLANALTHTAKGGKVSVVLTENEFAVSNSGEPLKGKSEQLFERFYKENQSETSTGLGLSLVKMVADSAGLQVKYDYQEQKHIFLIQFS
jgi:signal transduction histidine kinase